MTAGQRRALLLWLGFVLACGFIVVRTPIAVDMSAFLPRTPSAEERVLVDQLRDGAVSRLILIGLEGAPPAELATASRALARSLSDSPDVLDVLNGPHESQADREFLWRNRYLLSPAVSAELFSPEGLHRALAADLGLLASSIGLLSKGMIGADPTGEMLRLLEPLMQAAGGAQVRHGVWFSSTGERALLMVQTRARGSDIDAQDAILTLIRAAFDTARKDAGGADTMRLLMAGPAVFSVETRDRIEADAWRLSLAALLAVSFVLLLARRSLLFLSLALAPAVTAGLAGAAAVSLGFGAIAGTTLGFGATLVGEAVDYAVYLIMQTPAGGSPALTLRRIAPVLRLGVLTSAVGFSPLVFSSFPGLAELGIFSIVGLIAAFGVTSWFLPALLPRSVVAARQMTSLARLIGPGRAMRRLRPLSAVLIAIAAGVLIANRHTLWDDSLASLSPLPPKQIELDQALRRDLGAPDVSDIIVVTATDQEEALRRSERVVEVLRRQVADGVLSGFSAPSLLLPSRQSQLKRQQSLPDAETLRHNLGLALVGLPFQSALFEPFLQDVVASRTMEPLTRHSLDGTALSLQLDILLLPGGDGWSAYLPLRGVADRARLESAIHDGAPPDTVLVNLKDGANGLYRNYRQEAGVQALLGAVALVALLLIRLRSAGRVVRLLFPLAGAVVMTAAIIVMLGHGLSMFNLVGLLLVVGVGSNYCLFLERRDDDGERAQTGLSLIVASLCTIMGFGTLAMSSIPVLYEIGMTVAIGASLSLFLAAAFVPPADEHTPSGTGGEVLRHE